jgi:hypothetical protein
VAALLKNQMRLLLVVDDARMARFIARGLREQAYAGTQQATGYSVVSRCCRITVQYLGGEIVPPLVLNIKNGQPTVLGIPNRQFRYIVFN